MQQGALADHFRTRPSGMLGWFQPHLSLSLEWIVQACPHKAARILDVGGGDSTLIADITQIATFAPDGPTQCAGVPTERYAPSEQGVTVDPHWTPRSVMQTHRTPARVTQAFTYCHLRKGEGRRQLD